MKIKKMNDVGSMTTNSNNNQINFSFSRKKLKEIGVYNQDDVGKLIIVYPQPKVKLGPKKK